MPYADASKKRRRDLERKRRARAANPDLDRAYYRANKERKRAQVAAYRRTHPEQVRASKHRSAQRRKLKRLAVQLRELEELHADQPGLRDARELLERVRL